MAINLVRNPGFEEDAEWGFSEPASTDNTNTRSGERCLCFVNSAGGGWQYAYQDIILEPGVTYTLQFYAKRSGRMDVWAAYQYLAANGNWQMVHAPSMLNQVTSTYSQMSYSFTLPNDILSKNVRIYINGGGDAGDVSTAWIDDISIMSPAGQVLGNTGFEGSASWGFYGPAGFCNGNSRSGSRCMSFVNPSNGGLQYAVQTVELTPGMAYTLKFWAKRSGRMDVWACYTYYDSTGGVHQMDSPSMLNQVGATYSQMSYSFTLPSNLYTNNVDIYIKGGGNASDVSTAWIDDVELVEASGGSGSSSTTTTCVVQTGNSAPLNVRAQPSTSSTLLGTLANGTTVVCEVYNSDWYKITYNGQIAYVMRMYLTLAGSSSTSGTTMYVDVPVGQTVNVRSGASTSSGILTTLPRATAVTAFSATSADWKRVITQSSLEGFIMATYLNPVNPNVETGENGVIMYVNVPVGQTVNIRDGASTNASLIFTLPRASRVTAFTCSTTGWKRIVDSQGRQGYCMETYLTASNPGEGAATGSTMYVNVPVGQTVNVRSQAGSDASVSFTLGRGAQVTAYSCGTTGWKRIVDSSSRSGYVMEEYLSSTSIGSSGGTAGTTMYVNMPAGQPLNVRSYAGLDASISFSLARGTQVTAYDAGTSGWKRIVDSQNRQGYVQQSTLSTTNPGSGGTLPQPGATSLSLVREGASTLKLNDSGQAVTDLTALLVSKGRLSAQSSVYTTTVKNAVTSFQQQHSVLSNDGIVGQCTLAVLEDDGSSSGWFTGQGTCRITAGQLVRCGFVGKHVIRPADVAQLNEAINSTQFSHKEQIKHLLAQGMKECDRGKTFTEYIWSEGSNAKYGGFYGGGFIQLTHNYNYSDFYTWLSTNYGTTDPKLKDWKTATKTVAEKYPLLAGAFYFSNYPGSNCKRINEYILANVGTNIDTVVKEVTRKIQGGTGSWAERKSNYNKVSAVLL
jgi:uncharacterized protein YgiM (DUF1202 family)